MAFEHIHICFKVSFVRFIKTLTFREFCLSEQLQAQLMFYAADLIDCEAFEYLLGHLASSPVELQQKFGAIDAAY